MSDYKSIESLSIKNIKGFGSPATTISVDIKPNRVNILFAPNGFGKSSIAAAFNSLKPRSLDVPKELKYHKNDSLDCELSVVFDGKTLSANKAKNDIQNEFLTFVINCRLDPVSVLHNMGKFSTSTGYLDVKNIVVLNSIPRRVSGYYSYNKIKSDFGLCGKVLFNIGGLLVNRAFLKVLPNTFDSLDSFCAAKRRVQIIEDIRSAINARRGTSADIVSGLSSDLFSVLIAEKKYSEVMFVLQSVVADYSDFERFSLFYQLLYLRKNYKSELKMAIERSEYEAFLEKFNKDLSMLDSTWKGIQAKESNGQLVVSYPLADEISNGQRDVLTFVSQLIAFSSKISDEKKYILIIDEVFDYLDDANTIAAQYYLSSFLKEHNNNIYLCLMTHLDPRTFRNYIFNKKLINEVYLCNNVPHSSAAMMAFIAFRQKLDKKIDEQKKLYDSLSSGIFHYYPEKVDYSVEINTIKSKAFHKDLKPTWGNSDVLHKILVEETNNYLSGNKSYDPYAVAIALRLRIEKILYDTLCDEDKEGFIGTKMTRNKFAYCEEHGVDIPDVYNIINAIHSEADHLSYDDSRGEFEEKTMVYKLQNRVILNVIRELFNWTRGLTIDASLIE